MRDFVRQHLAIFWMIGMILNTLSVALVAFRKPRNATRSVIRMTALEGVEKE